MKDSPQFCIYKLHRRIVITLTFRLEIVTIVLFLNYYWCVCLGFVQWLNLQPKARKAVKGGDTFYIGFPNACLVP
ncbi:hypothetical protein SY85_24880 [Flavisolibacter tropicus]|uniref:Uncharacterized protein n=1 Tax=Flavisolibacter tropicus TaxID=1492898 RepID=A0A172U261_9BACT|nr:hypothetical protein SY85_24880 [Flavisolibacter tropicus]